MNLPRYNPAEHKLASAVARSPRLTALLPADQVTPLVEAYDRAVKIAEEAKAIAVEAADPTAEIHTAIQTGTDVDVPAAIARMAEARAAKAAQEEAARFFSTLPYQYREDLARLIEDVEQDLYEGLGVQLDAVLDRAEVVLRDLGGITDAEAAIDADLGGEFREFRTLAEEYASIRDAQRRLLFAARDSVLNNHSPALAAAFFAGAAAFAPTKVSGGTPRTDGGVWKTPKAEVDLLDTGSRAHFEFVLKNRAALRPRVENGETTSTPLHEDTVQLAPRQLSAREEYTLREIKRAAAQKVADDRADLL